MLRTSSLRGLGAWANVYAIESFIDELAEIAGEDPVSYRLLLSDPRARRVVETAAQMSGWFERRACGEGQGRGFGFARYKNIASSWPWWPTWRSTRRSAQADLVPRRCRPGDHAGRRPKNQVEGGIQGEPS